MGSLDNVTLDDNFTLDDSMAHSLNEDITNIYRSITYRCIRQNELAWFRKNIRANRFTSTNWQPGPNLEMWVDTAARGKCSLDPPVYIR